MFFRSENKNPHGSCHTASGLLLIMSLILSVNTSRAQNDTVNVYEKIKNTAVRYKLTTWLYYSIFVDPKPNEYPKEPSSLEDKIVNPYLNYEKKIIRNIKIIVRDPFYLTGADSLETEDVFLKRTGNWLHVKTRPWVIRNKLLFKKGDTLNALALSETERLLREPSFVNDAAIFLTGDPSGDSVDVNVLVSDKWSLTAPVVLTDIDGNVRLREQNIIGLGHQFEQYVGFNRKEIETYSGYYNIANIDHTFISGRVYYEVNKTATIAGIAFDRPFYSPLAKWAGGITITRSWKFSELTDSTDNLTKRIPQNTWFCDLWAGKTFKLKSRKKLFDQSTNIVAAVRYFTNQRDKSSDLSGLTNSNINSSSFIGNIGLSLQQYYKDKFIYRFGSNEDIPHGILFQLLYGVQINESQKPKYYLGFEAARAKRFSYGYFSSAFSYGIFFNRYMSNDITINYRFDYISRLFRLGNWYVREFAKFGIVYGENKPPDQRLTLNGEDLYGLKNSAQGLSKTYVNYEIVAYAPYNIIGFRFAPVILTGLGSIMDINTTRINGHIYQAYALGLMIRNENLLVNTFQVSVGVYPYNNNLFQYNPITSFTLKVKAFSVSKPDFVSYY